MSLIKRKLIRISSKDRNIFQSKSTTDFFVGIRSLKLQKVQSVALKYIRFVNASSNVNKNNATIRFTYNSVDYKDDITWGQYNINDLVSEVESKINALITPDVITMTFNVAAQRVTISSPQLMTILFEDNLIFQMLGYKTDVIDQNILDADALPNLSGLNEIYLYSDALASSHMVDSKSDLKNILTVVPVDVSYGAIQSYNSPEINSDRIVYNRLYDISSIDVKLLDCEMKVIDLQGLDIEIIFECFTT